MPHLLCRCPRILLSPLPVQNAVAGIPSPRSRERCEHYSRPSGRRGTGSGLCTVGIAATASGPPQRGDLPRPPSEAQQALARVRRANCDAEFGPTAQTMTIVALLRDQPIAFRASSADAGAALRLISSGFVFYGRAALDTLPLLIDGVMSAEPFTPHGVVDPPLITLSLLPDMSRRTFDSELSSNAPGTTLARPRGFLDGVAALLDPFEAAPPGDFEGGCRRQA